MGEDPSLTFYWEDTGIVAIYSIPWATEQLPHM